MHCDDDRKPRGRGQWDQGSLTRLRKWELESLPAEDLQRAPLLFWQTLGDAFLSPQLQPWRQKADSASTTSSEDVATPAASTTPSSIPLSWFRKHRRFVLTSSLILFCFLCTVLYFLAG